MATSTQSLQSQDAHVVSTSSLSSASIPFPAPASPLRSKRNAARAATDAMSASKQTSDNEDAAGMDVDQDEPDLTNDDTAESWTAVEGETDGTLLNDDLADEVKMAQDEGLTEEEAYQSTIRKRKSPAKRKAKAAVTDDEEATVAVDGAEPKAKPKRRTKKAKSAPASPVNGNASDDSALTPAQDLEAKPKKTRKPPKPRAPKPEPVYVIPDVEQLPNPGFKGRLGYACLNTILRNQKPPVFCSRTCRIDTIKKNGMDFLKELGRQNVKDLLQLIQWNEDNNIRFLRLSSEMFPFASHGEYGYTLEYADKELKEAGDLAKKYGHRLTSHPGQFTQLGSPRKVVVDNAVKDLQYHCEMIDRMGLDQDSVMIIHGGGVFGDKAATIERLKKNYVEKLPDNVKARVVLENDELCYNVDDLLPVCEELNIPLVLDYHHHSIFPTAEQSLEELMPRILATWHRKGIRPKFHLSEPRPGAVTVMERRAHSDRCKLLPTPLPEDIDIMIEAKDKEQAVFELHRIYDLQPTVHASLRPPAEVETLHTNGRKSSKKKKKAAEGEDEDVLEEVDPDEEMVAVEGAEVAPPVEPTDAKKAKTPAKRGRKKADSDDSADGDSEKAKTPAKRGRKKAESDDPADGDSEKTPKKKAAPRKPRAKKAAVKEEDKASKIEEEVRAEPPEAEPVEDMKLKDVPDPVIEKAEPTS